MDMDRYSVVDTKRKREIVLLRGSGCVYKRCTFCDYHLDRCNDEDANFALNAEVLAHVTGCYGDLEVINSGSVFELSAALRRCTLSPTGSTTSASRPCEPNLPPLHSK